MDFEMERILFVLCITHGLYVACESIRNNKLQSLIMAEDTDLDFNATWMER